MKEKIDLDLCGNSQLFLHIKSQSDLVIEIFHRLAADFPQIRLAEFHPKSKGSKVSKGYRLQDCPYEVLDLIRDFDPKHGMNLRILQWWGHGLYFLVQIGTENPRRPDLLAKAFDSFFISDHPDPWDYPKVLNAKKKLDQRSALEKVNEGHFFQIFKRIQVSDSPETLLNDLKREILLIMDNHH